MHNLVPISEVARRSLGRPGQPVEPAGKAALPSALSPLVTGRPATEGGITRRSILAAVGALVVVAALPLTGCGSASAPGKNGGVDVFALSSRGRRVSRAAKGNSANKRFMTAAEADLHRAHPGDTCRIVKVTISLDQFHRLFGDGNVVGDLRHLA